MPEADSPLANNLDCFASLAMTVNGRGRCCGKDGEKSDGRRREEMDVLFLEGVSGILLIEERAMEREEMNVLFLRFLDRILNMVDGPVVLFDKELNPVKANAAGWRFFDTCKNTSLT